MPADPLVGTARLGDAVWTVLLALLLAAPATLHAQARPDFAGVWSTTMITPDDEAWNLEDYGCFLGCMFTAYERLRALLNDPANDERPYEKLMVEAWWTGRELEPGDRVRIRGNPGRDGAQTIRMLALTLPDGRELAAEDVDFEAIDRRRRR